MNVKKLNKPVSSPAPNFHRRQLEAYAYEVISEFSGKRGVQQLSLDALTKAGFTCSSIFTRYGKGRHGTTRIATKGSGNRIDIQLGGNKGSKWTYRELTTIELTKPGQFNKWKRGFKALSEIRLEDLYRYLHSYSKVADLHIEVEIGGVEYHNHLAECVSGLMRFRLHFRGDKNQEVCFTYVGSEKDYKDLYELRYSRRRRMMRKANERIDASELLEELEVLKSVQRYFNRLEKNLLKSRKAKLRLLLTPPTSARKKKEFTLSQVA